jgi:ferritin-like metal-binding protein YciE
VTTTSSEGEWMETARELFEEELKQAYGAEKHLVKAWEQIAGKVSNQQLSKTLKEEVKGTKEHVARLEDIFKLVGTEARAEKPRAITGMLDDFKTFVSQQKPSDEMTDFVAADVIIDLEQYLMQTYDSLSQLAEKSGVSDATPTVGDLIGRTMKDEKKTAKQIQKLSKQLVEELRPS